MDKSDTEALRALVAKWRNRSGIGSGSYHISPEIRECADELEEALERLLASQGKPEAEAATKPWGWAIGNMTVRGAEYPGKPGEERYWIQLYSAPSLPSDKKEQGK